MRILKLIQFFFVLVSTAIGATTFIPASIEKQIESASFGIEAELLKKTPFKNDNGFIYTRHEFKVIEAFGTDIEFLSLELPGGTLGDLGTAVEGAPQFKNGVKYFLLIKEIENKFYLSNFTLGQYEIQRIGDQIYYVSSVFPFDKTIGRINKEHFKKLMFEKWNLVSRLDGKHESIKLTIENKKAIEKKKPNQERKIASTERSFDFEKWYIFLLAFTCVGISFYLIKSRWDEK